MTVQPETESLTASLLERGDRHNSPNYKPGRMVISHGQGMKLYDTEGVEYLDFMAGIAVCALGHNDSGLVSAIADQAAKVMHISNAFYTEPQVRLMETLANASFGDRVYLCNSGTEANEAAMKLARRYQKTVANNPERVEFVTMNKSFHGRTLASITATGQPKYHKGFEPLVPGYAYADFNDLESVKALVTDKTAAIMVEPVQGEGGVKPSQLEFLQGLRELADATGALLIFDEVQTGIGRLGTRFGYQHFGVAPDIMTLAKGLGGGFPVGATIATSEVFAGFERGSHASTFGGNPLACAAANAVLDRVFDDAFLDHVKTTGRVLRQALVDLNQRLDCFTDVRGVGLLVGAECADAQKAGAIVLACREQGLFINTAGGNTLRFVPPLIAKSDDVAEAISRLERAIEAVG